MRMSPAIALLLGSILLTGCGGGGPQPPGVAMSEISFSALERVNQDSAIAVDLVLAYDQKILAQLEGLPARQYFSSVDQLRRTHPSALDIWRWEIVPGQMVAGYKPVVRDEKAWGALVFMDYQAPGDHRLTVGTSPSMHVVLGEKDVQAVTTETPEEEPEGFEVYPVDETVILNTHTPDAGLTQAAYAQSQKSDAEDHPAQAPSKPPQPAVGKAVPAGAKS